MIEVDSQQALKVRRPLQHVLHWFDSKALPEHTANGCPESHADGVQRQCRLEESNRQLPCRGSGRHVAVAVLLLATDFTYVSRIPAA